MNPLRRTTTAAATTVALATTGSLLTLTATPATAATACSSPVYKRQIFANTSFSGTAKQTACDSAVSENWGTGSPATGVPSNNFSVRWSVTRDFGSGGPFTLASSGLDGIRVYVDGHLKINLWKNTSTAVGKTLNLTLGQGRHTLRVDYVNWTGSAKVAFSYAPRTSATYDKVKPLAPTGLTATYDKATSRTRLTWAKNREMDLAGYRLYRRPVSGTTWSRIALLTSPATTAYTDTTIPADGAGYVYRLSAYDKAGNENAGTTSTAITTSDRTAPAVPAGLLTDGEPAGLRLTWSASPGAASYRVYRATQEAGPYNQLAATAQASHLDTTAVEGTPYYYRVAAVDAAGNVSARSAAFLSVLGDEIPPPPVTGLTVTPTEYGFVLRWDANPAPDLVKYEILQGRLWGEEGRQTCAFHVVADVSATTTTRTWPLLPDGDEACFMVRAVDEVHNTGDSARVVATALDMIPSVPTPGGSPLMLAVTGAQHTQGNHLGWEGIDTTAPEQAGGYRIYRWNPAASAYEKIGEVAGGVQEFDDIDAQRGTTTFYRVTALAADGTETLPADDYIVSPPLQ
ncbi:fibronectin type III domain-containing protein [Streptomyces sp. NPDC003522]